MKKTQNLKVVSLSKREIPIDVKKQKIEEMYQEAYIEPQRRITIQNFDENVYKKMQDFEEKKKNKIDQLRITKLDNELKMTQQPKNQKITKKVIENFLARTEENMKLKEEKMKKLQNKKNNEEEIFKSENCTFKPKTNQKNVSSRTIDDLLNWQKKKKKKITNLRKKSIIEDKLKMNKEVKKSSQKNISLNENNYISENVVDRLQSYQIYYDQRRQQLIDQYRNCLDEKPKTQVVSDFGNSNENFIEKNFEIKKEFRDKNRRKTTYLHNINRIEKEFIFKKGEFDLIKCEPKNYGDFEKQKLNVPVTPLFQKVKDRNGFNVRGENEDPSKKQVPDFNRSIKNPQIPQKDNNDLNDLMKSFEDPEKKDNSFFDFNCPEDDLAREEGLSKIGSPTQSQKNMDNNNSNFDTLVKKLNDKPKKNLPFTIDEKPEFLDEKDCPPQLFNDMMENFLDPHMGQIPSNNVSFLIQEAPTSSPIKKQDSAMSFGNDNQSNDNSAHIDFNDMDTDSMREFKQMLMGGRKFSVDELKKDPRRWLIYHDLSWRPIWRPPPKNKELNYVNNHLKKINDYLKI